MEELQAIETTSGRQFKPWVDADKLQEIVSDPASVTAITSEIASGKQAIAAAINAKGGSASAIESFSELAQAVEDIPNYSDMAKLAGIIAGGNYSKNVLQGHNENVKYGKTEIVDRVGAFVTINVTSCFQYWDLLKRVNLPNLVTISGGSVFASCSALEEVNLPNLINFASTSLFNGCFSLEEIFLPNLETYSGTSPFTKCTSLKRLLLPKLTIVLNQFCENVNSLIEISFGKLTSVNFGNFSSQPNLRSITVGQDTNVNLPFNQWTASNVIAEGQSGIDELNSNLQTNLISKLYQGGGKILRLGAALYDVTTQETRDMVTAKGWTLQRG